MICPYCNANDDKVIDSRASEAGRVVRRRRQCLKCGKRFTTYERVEESSRLMVVKRDGTRAPFDREKVLTSVAAACGKRPISEDTKIQLVDDVEEELHRRFEREAPSKMIGELVMERLRELDEVAYIRFASEYHQFADLGVMMTEMQQLRERPRDVKDQAQLF